MFNKKKKIPIVSARILEAQRTNLFNSDLKKIVEKDLNEIEKAELIAELSEIL